MNKITVMLIGVICALSSSVWSIPAPVTKAELSTALKQDGGDPNSEFIISIWTTGEGLPVNEVLDLKETPDGYLWLGTYRGVVRFDGVRCQSFLATPTGMRYGMEVSPLEIDSRGRLWLAPDQVGLVYLEDGKFSEVLTNRAVLRDRPISLCSDGTNNLMWVDAIGRLGRISIDKPDKAELIKGGGASGSSQWMRDFKGKMWLVNPRNLRIFQQGKWREIAVPGTATLVATPRRAGGVWAARDAKLRSVSDDGKRREIATFPWVGQTRVTCLLEDRHERLWIGTVGQGLYCYEAGEFKQVVPMSSGITCLLEDNQDNIWAGTRGAGLVRVRERQFFMHDLSSGLKNEFVRSLSQDTTGRVWMVTAESGLGWWENGTWRSLGEADGWSGYDALCVVPSSKGGVWVSTVNRGLLRWVDGEFIKQEFGTKAPKEPPADLLEDRQGRLWMVTDNSGVYCLEGNKLTNYSTKDGLPSNLTRRIVEDEAGDIWVGDWEGGISKFRTNRWQMVRKPFGHGDAVRSMVATEGALWIGTSAGGLLRLKDGQSSRVSVEEGLPDISIQQLLLDGRGSLWGGTPHKLFRISLEQLNAVMDGGGQQIEPILYGRSDGLPDLSFASWSDPRSWLTTNGVLWFATANGALHFQPDNLKENKPSQAILEQTLLDGKPATAEALQQLRPGKGRLEFRFTAPCLSAPERIRFRYKLSDVDPTWVDAGTARSVSYPIIPAGDHVFQVVASSPEGVWSSQPASIALSVHPFFWQTNWFLAAIAAATAGGGVWIIRRAAVLRLRRRLELLRHQHAVDRERARIAQDIHDELGANLTSIGLLADMGTRHKFDSFKVAGELRQISETARESVAAMDAIVWALNPRNDSLDNFANYVAQFTREFFRPTQLRTRLELPADLPAHRLATETRHQLFLIVKESFNNIVRHAEATEVYLELACDNGHLSLVIADNGKGISSKTISEGQNGLDNLRERIERLGGALQIKSENGQGARLEFILPLANFGAN